MNKNRVLLNAAKQNAGLSMMRSQLTMRKDTPKSGNWFRIENKKSADDETVVSTDVYIYDEIGFWGTTAADFVDEINKIDAKSFNLHINSPGGEIFDGLAIYNSIKSHKASVTVYVDGIAASAASFIAMAGDEIIIGRNAQMMIHDGLGIVFGNEADMLKQAEVLGNLSNNIADIYAQRAGGTLDEWRNLMRAETWYNGREAKAAGLVDVVTDVDDEEAQNRINLWDLTGFHYSNRGEAPPPSAVRASVLNKIKEKSVPQKNVTEGQSSEQENEDQVEDEQTEKESSTETPPVTVTPAGGQPVVVEPSESDVPSDRVVINGATVTDFRAINRHIASLETFHRETREANRLEFVQQLARDHKILASQVDKTAKFANGLTDTQYADWQESYDGVPGNRMFGNHDATSKVHSTETGSAPVNSTDDQISIWTETVQRHKVGGMPVDKIMNTTSYKKLVAAKPDFVL